MWGCKYLNQRVRRICERNRNSFKGFSKTNKQEKKKQEEIEFHNFITPFKIDFQIPFTGCRKVVGKMPALFTLLVPW